jgi:hypothetical protein
VFQLCQSWRHVKRGPFPLPSFYTWMDGDGVAMHMHTHARAGQLNARSRNAPGLWWWRGVAAGLHDGMLQWPSPTGLCRVVSCPCRSECEQVPVSCTGGRKRVSTADMMEKTAEAADGRSEPAPALRRSPLCSLISAAKCMAGRRRKSHGRVFITRRFGPSACLSP